MKAATIHALKREMSDLDAKQLLKICLRLALFKKENKELLTYLIFEVDDEEGYIMSVKSEIEEMISQMNRSNIYFTKKSVRKILRHLDKFIRYSTLKQTEVELRIFLCSKLKEAKIPFWRSKVLRNMLNRQIHKIQSAISSLHEDLQYDYNEELSALGLE